MNKYCPECGNEMFVGFKINKMIWLCIYCKIGVEQ